MTQQYKQGHLSTRAMAYDKQVPIASGIHHLNLDQERDTLLYIPENYQATHHTPLIVMLHGAGGTAQGGLALLQYNAERYNVALLAPASRGQTWDMIQGRMGPDAQLLDQALHNVFQQVSIDQSRVALAGFSDGASYALSLGLANGDLFTHIIAFSPGFMVTHTKQGKPFIYVSHGKQDSVLPIGRCSRHLVPQLQRENYDVLYHEFTGPHTIPPTIAHEAIQWFLGIEQPD